MKKHAGYSLIEMTVVMGMIAVIIASLALQQQRASQIQLADAAGSELAQLAQAAESFIASNYGPLVGIDFAGALIPIPPDLVAKGMVCSENGPAPRTGADRICDIPGEALAARGFMPANWTGSSTGIASSGKWMLRTRVSQTLSANGTLNYSVQGLILSQLPFALADGVPNEAVAGRAVLASRNVAAGYVPLGGADFETIGQAIKIPAASWDWNGSNAPLNPAKFINAPLQYGALAGLQSAMNNLIYLRRDGLLPMTGDLHMGYYTAAEKIQVMQRWPYADPSSGITNYVPCSCEQGAATCPSGRYRAQGPGNNPLYLNSRIEAPAGFNGNNLGTLYAEALRTGNTAMQNKIVDFNLCPADQGYNVKSGADLMRFYGNLDVKGNAQAALRMQVGYQDPAHVPSAAETANAASWKAQLSTSDRLAGAQYAAAAATANAMANPDDLAVNGNATMQCDPSVTIDGAPSCASFDAKYKGALYVGVRQQSGRTGTPASAAQPENYSSVNWKGYGINSLSGSFHETPKSTLPAAGSTAVNLEKNVTVGTGAGMAGGQGAEALRVLNSAQTDGAMVVVGGGQITTTPNTMGVVNDTNSALDSVIAGTAKASRISDKGGLSVRDAYVWNLDYDTNSTTPNSNHSPYLSTLLGPFPITYTGVAIRKLGSVQNNTQGPSNLVNKSLAGCRPDGAGGYIGEPKIYLTPNMFYGSVDLGVLVKQNGFAFYAQDNGASWEIHALTPDGFEAVDYGIVYALTCFVGQH